jgi:hypothetical protein
VKYIVFGLFMGVALGMAVSGVIASQKKDSCQASLTSSHFSVCLDSKIDKAKELFR